MAGGRCWGHVSPIVDSFGSVRFGSRRAVRFSVGREAGGPSSGWFRPRSVGEDPAGYETIATHSSVSFGRRARGLYCRRIYRHDGVGHKNTALVPYPTGLIGAGALALISGGRTAQYDQPSEQSISCDGRAMAAFGIALVRRGGVFGCPLPLALPWMAGALRPGRRSEQRRALMAHMHIDMTEIRGGALALNCHLCGRAVIVRRRRLSSVLGGALALLRNDFPFFPFGIDVEDNNRYLFFRSIYFVSPCYSFCISIFATQNQIQ